MAAGTGGKRAHPRAAEYCNPPAGARGLGAAQAEGVLGMRRQLLSATLEFMTFISSEAPLGRAMLGKCEGDEVPIRVAPIRQQFEVLRVQ